MSDIPEWAWRRAVELAGFDWELYKEGIYGMGGTKAIGAFARYIAEHEQPPRDKLREIVNGTWHLMRGTRGRAIDAVTQEIRARLPQAALDAIEEMDDD
jgi:hypothetical protein